MNYKFLDIKSRDGVSVITINRPDKLNALSIEVVKEITSAFEAAEKDDDIKGVIITGSGEKAFVAGADISEFAPMAPGEAKQMAENGHRMMDTIENLSKPVIAAVNGFALGGGCELAMACHIRVASDNARFGQPEINLGIIPGYGGTQRLVKLIGPGKATELLLTADNIKAEEAKTLGLVNYVVPQPELMDKCMEIMAKITSKSPLVVRQLLKLVLAYGNKEENGFKAEINEFEKCFSAEDQKEGVAAFLEKRKPVFKGK